MRDDPFLGSGSYGQTSRFCVERCYIMHKLLAELEEGRWKQRSEFKQYNAVVKKIEKETNKNGSEVG